MNRFEGRGALITGSTKGIDRAIAEAFMDEGAKVGVLDIDEDAGEALSYKKGLLYIKGDAGWPHDQAYG
ncbi:MAG: SDR family NAD(P)-dependent oxidoreductase, partial [Clostridia bacterium]|nr:SDR family NAD(P)-dependent oxidoreductase [Clostridia bacterium]